MYVPAPLLLLLILLAAGLGGIAGGWWVQRQKGGAADEPAEKVVTPETPLPVVAGVPLRDAQTGLYNREALLEALARHLSLADRSKQPVTVLMVEIDSWLQLSQPLAVVQHTTVLRAVAQRMAARVRNHDLLGHWDEARFLVVLPDSDVGGALVLAQDLSECLSLQPLDIDGQPLSLTVSIGVYGRHSTPQNRLQHMAPDMVVGAERALEVSVGDGPGRIAINP